MAADPNKFLNSRITDKSPSQAAQGGTAYVYESGTPTTTVMYKGDTYTVAPTAHYYDGECP